MAFLSSILGSFNLNLFLYAAAILAVGSLVLNFVGKLIFGSKSSFHSSLSSAIAILFVYAATVVLYSMGAQFQGFIAPLPFVTIQGDDLLIFSFQGAVFADICSQILSMVILAFLANLIDGFVPKGKHMITWLFFRCVSIVGAMGLHVLISNLMNTLLPQGIVTYAPTVLLVLLVLMLAVGALKFVVGALLATVNPIIGALYTFFFATVIGKQLSKAMLTTLILCALVYALNFIGITVISIANAALMAYVPLLIILALIWYLVNKNM